MELSSPLELILPFQFIVLTVPSSQVWCDGPMLHPWLQVDAKNLLYCCETSLNTQLKHSHDCFCSIVRKRGTHLEHSFPIIIRFTALFEMPTMSASSHTFSRRSSNTILWIFFTFSSWSPHLVDHCDDRLRSSYDLV